MRQFLGIRFLNISVNFAPPFVGGDTYNGGKIYNLSANMRLSVRSVKEKRREETSKICEEIKRITNFA